MLLQWAFMILNSECDEGIGQIEIAGSAINLFWQIHVSWNVEDIWYTWFVELSLNL